MNWKLLGIEPTKDKKAITAAYRAQLQHTNPEDKPEEFKALRAAYEEALRLADQETEEPVRDESPVGLWLEKVVALYNDYQRRINPENWAEILTDDVCAALDTRPLAEEALLKFLMNSFYIPQKVWNVLNNAFSWTERKNELYETYPRDFVDYAVMNGINYRENLPYELFTPGSNSEECDEYRNLYYQATHCAPEEVAALLAQIEKLSESHPYGEMMAYQMMVKNGDTEQGLKGCHQLADSYPHEAILQLDWASQCMNMSNWTEGESYVRRALDISPDHIYANQMLATCLANQGKYDDAKNIIYQLMDAAGGDQKRIYELTQILQNWNEKLMQQLESQLETNPEDMKARIDLGWCYLQNEQAPKAFELCKTIDPNYEDPYDYHNLYGKVAYAVGEFAVSLSHMQAAEELLRQMTPDGTKKTATRIESLPEKLQMQGSCLINMGNKEEAIQKFEQALELAPENPEVLTHMGRLLCSIDELERAAEIFEKLTNVMPDSYHGFYLLSQTLFDLNRDRDAFDAINRALNLEGGDLGVYLLKMRILLRNGAWEGVREIIDFLHKNGITDEINTLWCEAQFLEEGEEKKDQALEIYRSLATRIENGEFLEEASSLYYHLLCLEAEHLDATQSEDRAKMLELADKGLSHNEKDYPCLDYKAWLLKRDGKKEEALAIYHMLESVPRRSMNVEAELAELYYMDLDHDADKSLHYYKLLLEQNEYAAYLFYAGTCCKYLDDYEESEKYFLRLQELYPDDIDGYNGLSYLYDTMKRYEDSLKQIDKVIELSLQYSGERSGYYYHKARILRRLNRPEEALATMDEMAKECGCEEAFKDKFDICCQFGLWTQAEEVLKKWNKSGKNKDLLRAAIIDLDLFTGNIEKARTTLRWKKKLLNSQDAERLTLLFGELDGDESVQMPILEKNAATKQDKTHHLMNMAQVQWWNGHYDKAREYAQEVLPLLEELIASKKRYEALYRSRRSIILAFLGRFDEAVAELEAVRKLPLCETCSYCSCKDADIFEANLEEIRENWEAALELHRKGAQRWPDDMDFVSGARRMMRKEL